ncbi:ABC-type transporter, integral membrane subunit [Desulfovibrio sp. X2]|uniref:ABC transporter permease n=1 Tax=Desulfovibrio sp. X2 TaxID=941449 RepID=UPI000358B6EE|nr:ABC transporter permease [Desulfovibrio sp. X2]EPR41505.1 ABC-type transporter, integral membrane subunit [Desulfovibrio sp. X2]
MSLLRIVPRERPLGPLFSLSLALAAALALGWIIFSALGVAPGTAYLAMAQGAFGSMQAVSEILVKATPLMLCGLAVAVAAQMLLWNVGCEGQLVMGGVFAAGTALFWGSGLPAPVLVPLELCMGMVGGALWALVPAALKAWGKVSEILTTLLLNYVAVILLEQLYYGPWRDPAGFGFPGTAELPDAAILPRLWPSVLGRVHLGLLLALLFAPLLFWILRRTRFGFSVRVIGLSEKAARYARLSIPLRTLAVLCFSGALAGLAGAGEVAGIHQRLQEGLAVGIGYDGIIVAWLARGSPLGVPLAAAALGALFVGADQLQTSLGLPSSIGQVLEAALLFGYLAGEFLSRHRLEFGARQAASGGSDVH